MMEGKIRIKIDRLGRPTVTGEGFAGQTCDEKMKPIEDAFGGRQIRENNPEYYLNEVEADNTQELTL
jgi:hypothetical protein